MNYQSGLQTLLYKLGGYYVIPHELLHVLAYRLIHKPCHYRWGDYRVYSTVQKTRGERLFILFFPLGICLALSLFFHFVWIILALSARLPLTDYLSTAPK